MSSLKATIESLANDFALSIISALRSASIDELMDLASRGPRPVRALGGGDAGRKAGRGKRLGRRSTSDIALMVDSIVALLQKHPEGLRAEQIREALDCQAKELPRPLADALAEGRLSKSGQKRATTYFAGAKARSQTFDSGPKRRRGRRPRA